MRGLAQLVYGVVRLSSLYEFGIQGSSSMIHMLVVQCVSNDISGLSVEMEHLLLKTVRFSPAMLPYMPPFRQVLQTLSTKLVVEIDPVIMVCLLPISRVLYG